MNYTVEKYRVLVQLGDSKIATNKECRFLGLEPIGDWATIIALVNPYSEKVEKEIHVHQTGFPIDHPIKQDEYIGSIGDYHFFEYKSEAHA